MRKDPSLPAALEVANEIITLVETKDVGGVRGDSNALFMFSAYLYGLRRFRVIRRVATDGAGPETVILARTLLSMTVRAIYLDQPRNRTDRLERWKEFARDDRGRAINELEGLRRAGFPVDDEVLAGCRKDLKKLGSGPGLPSDAQLMKDPALRPFYVRLYTPGSDYVHFGLGRSIEELQDVKQVDTNARQDAVAWEALCGAIITYGLLLHASERVVGHGLDGQVRQLIEAADAFTWDSDAPEVKAQ